MLNIKKLDGMKNTRDFSTHRSFFHLNRHHNRSSGYTVARDPHSGHFDTQTVQESTGYSLPMNRCV